MLHQGGAGVDQAQAQVFAYEIRLLGGKQHGVAVVEFAHFHQRAQPVQGFAPCALPPGGVRVVLRGGFFRARLQGAFQHQRHAGNGGFQPVQPQGGAGNVEIGAVFQGGQVAAHRLFDGQQVGLLEAVQTAFDVFQYGNGHGDVARQQELLRGHVERGFGFVHQPVGAAAQQFAVGGGGVVDLFLIRPLAFGKLHQGGGQLVLAAAGFLQDFGVFALAYGGLVNFLVEGHFLRFQHVLPLHEQESARTQSEEREHQRADGQAFAAGLLDDDGCGGLGLGGFAFFLRGGFRIFRLRCGRVFRRPVCVLAV